LSRFSIFVSCSVRIFIDKRTIHCSFRFPEFEIYNYNNNVCVIWQYCHYCSCDVPSLWWQSWHVFVFESFVAAAILTFSSYTSEWIHYLTLVSLGLSCQSYFLRSQSSPTSQCCLSNSHCLPLQLLPKSVFFPKSQSLICLWNTRTFSCSYFGDIRYFRSRFALAY
jgi:hypothetical protein